MIGTNKADAAETVRALLADLGERSGERQSIEELLEKQGVRVVTYDGLGSASTPARSPWRAAWTAVSA